jgi:peroxiredoxin
LIEVGQKAPDFKLPDHDGKDVSLADFAGRRLLLVFYPLDFSPVCTDQLTAYREIVPELDEAGVEMVGISVDSAFAHAAFREKLGVDTVLLADFEPKGKVASDYGVYLDGAGIAARALVLIDGDGVVEWVYETDTPADIPPPSVILEAI